MENTKFEPIKNKIEYLRNESTPDCYKFSGDLDQLVKFAQDIFNKMEPHSAGNDIRNELLGYGNEVRAFEGGIFAITITGSKNASKLFIQNRNARGDKQYQEKLKNFLIDHILN